MEVLLVGWTLFECKSEFAKKRYKNNINFNLPEDLHIDIDRDVEPLNVCLSNSDFWLFSVIFIKDKFDISKNFYF